MKIRLLASLESAFAFSHYFMFKRYHSQIEVEFAKFSKKISHSRYKIKNNHNRNPKIHGINFKEIIDSIYKLQNFDYHRDINSFTNSTNWIIKTYNHSESTLYLHNFKSTYFLHEKGIRKRFYNILPW